jgi:geranylgeranyl reductase family protein
MNAPLRVAGDAEIIVVGAGPAGASCAALLAERGHDVLLLDQSSFPRDKPCGDGLTRSAVAALRRIGLDDLLASSEQVHGMRILIDHELSEYRKYDPTPRRPDRARCIRRGVLDHALLQAAIDRGVRFLEARVLDRAGPPGSAGVQALIGSERCVLQSRFVVAADGATSRLRRTSVHPRREDALSAYAARAYFRCERPVEPIFDIYMPLASQEGKRFAGYGWVFPIDEHVANIGIGYWRGRGISSPAKIRDVFALFVEQLRTRARARFGELQQVSKLAGSPLGVQFQRDYCEADGVVFVGDAARTTDPWSGEGIAYAIHGGELIAKLISARVRSHSRPLDAGTVLSRRFGRLRHDMSFPLRFVEPRFDRSPASLANGAQQPFLITMQHAILAPDTEPDLLDTPVGALARRDVEMSDRLERINEILLDELGNAFPFAAETLHSVIRGGLGPINAIMLLALGDAAHDDVLLAAASAIELICASAGPAREIVDRPRGSGGHVNNALCVLMSDYALSRGARQAARAGGLLIQELSTVMKLICQEQFAESQRLFDPDRTAEDYLRSAQARMAGPLALAARVAASTRAPTPVSIDRLDAFSRKLGLAAQVFEDTDELLHGIPVKEQQPGRDLCLGGYCFPVLYAAERDGALHELLLGGMHQNDLPAIVKSIFQTGAMAKTLQLVTDTIEEAESLLDGLDGSGVERLRALATLTLEHTRTSLGGWSTSWNGNGSVDIHRELPATRQVARA